jgi:hypothetical protein
MPAMSPLQVTEFLSNWALGRIPVWDQAMLNMVGWRTSFDSEQVILYSPFLWSAGAILYSPDATWQLETLTVTSGTNPDPTTNTAGSANVTIDDSAATAAAAAQTAAANAGNLTLPGGVVLPGWAVYATGAAAVLLFFVAEISGGRRR